MSHTEAVRAVGTCSEQLPAAETMNCPPRCPCWTRPVCGEEAHVCFQRAFRLLASRSTPGELGQLHPCHVRGKDLREESEATSTPGMGSPPCSSEENEDMQAPAAAAAPALRRRTFQNMHSAQSFRLWLHNPMANFRKLALIFPYV